MDSRHSNQLGAVTRFLRAGTVPIGVVSLVARTVEDHDAFLEDLEDRAQSEVFDRDAFRDFKVAFTRLRRNAGNMSVNIPLDIRARLKRYAAMNKITESEAVRRVLDEALPHENESTSPAS